MREGRFISGFAVALAIAVGGVAVMVVPHFAQAIGAIATETSDDPPAAVDEDANNGQQDDLVGSKQPPADDDAGQAAVEVSAPEEPSESSADDPAPANDRASDDDAEPQDAPPGEEPAELPTDESDAKPVSEATNEASEDPALDAASLKGVQPGTTTREELHANWGSPKRIDKIPGGAREMYVFPPFDRVHVTIVDDVVGSLALRLEKPIAVERIIKQLEIAEIEPVDVFDVQGRVVGQSFPESGMLFGFVADARPRHVNQIVIQALDAQPFLARAEMRLQSRYTDCFNDITRALELSPDNSRAHALRAELMLAAGDLEQALKSARRAVELDGKDRTHRLTLAKVLAAGGDYPQAVGEVSRIAESPAASALVRGRAYCLWGDCLAASADHDFAQAIKHHQRAIELARVVSTKGEFPATRLARELQVDAHLAVAHDIGWGRWQQKPQAVAKWLDRAIEQVDMLVDDEQGSPEARLRVHERALAAIAGIAEPPDVAHWVRRMTELGQKMIEETTDPAYKAHLAWQFGAALSDALEIEAARKNFIRAVALGKGALKLLEDGDQAGQQLPAHDQLRGQICYRLGTIAAIEQADHEEAITWFDEAVPLLESPVPLAVSDPGKQGEAFVSMAISYWETNHRTEALRLTNQGLKLMEEAAQEGWLANAALAVPYGNLASMHQQLGNSRDAKKFAELASRHEAKAAEKK